MARSRSATGAGLDPASPFGSTPLSLLVLNTGSSSLKFGLFDAEARAAIVSGQVDWRDPGRPAELVVRPEHGPERRSPREVADPGSAADLALRAVADAAPGGSIAAIGHRIVHGGSRFRATVRIDDAVEAEIHRLTELAPLHNPPALAALAAARRARPEVPQFASFDTTFFADLPRSAATYPVPRGWTEDWGIRRFGFHGISHSYCAGKAAEILGRDPGSLRLVVCHLGNGASAAAIRGGRAVDTTMGFTPLTGLMMGTRSGSVDPGILLYVMKEKGQTVDQVDNALNHASGLVGVSGVSADYREVERAAGGGDDRARLALEIYAARVRSAIGALAATLGGLDAVAFAAGVGEHSATLRAAVCADLRFLGLHLDPARNEAGPVDADIAEAGSPARILVIHTREELQIAREVRRLLGAG